ncbi:OmpA family protein [Flectobacillus longus]|uniref:OmpA family protein n=1 Tax=Flectobacillus longus TaxID=2984207 RepID=UPI0024B6909A|nr:OmpA family protein [Flectobacillus longus]MDI9880883.1 OmpA family protein [Flectobacillus longus]
MKTYVTIIVLLLYSSVTFSQILRVCYIPNYRSQSNSGSDDGYTFDGLHMINHSTVKLTDPSNFGPEGVVKTSIVTVPLNDNPITPNTIRKANCGAILVGGFGYWDGSTLQGSALAVPELNTIRNWSIEKNTNLVIVSQSEVGVWGYYNINGNANPNKPTFQGRTSRIFNGPFGKVTFFDQGGGYQGSIAGENFIPLSTDNENRVTIAFDKPTNDIILGDIDILTDLGGISSGSRIQNSNDILFANIWAYAVELAVPQIKQAETKSIVQGKVFDKESLTPVKTIIKIVGDKTTMQSISTSSDGQYRYESLPNDICHIAINAEGYEPLNESISIDKDQLTKNFFLTPKPKSNTSILPSITFEGKILKKGETVVLDNIQFEQGLSDLLPDGKKALDQVVKLLQQNTSLVIELSGHTSNEGDEYENRKLSNQRAEVCKQYLMKQITDADRRITTIGYGSSRPKVPNNSEKNRITNRRVELQIINF